MQKFNYVFTLKIKGKLVGSYRSLVRCLDSIKEPDFPKYGVVAKRLRQPGANSFSLFHYEILKEEVEHQVRRKQFPKDEVVISD